jgi:hypothetical protein
VVEEGKARGTVKEIVLLRETDMTAFILVLQYPICITYFLKTRPSLGAPWQGHGHVMCIEDGEISLEMRCTSIPHNISEGYVAEFVWKSTSYDRCDPASSNTLPIDFSYLSHSHALLLFLGSSLTPSLSLYLPLQHADCPENLRSGRHQCERVPVPPPARP